MKVKVTETLLDYTGKPLKGDNDKDLTYRDVFLIALNGSLPGEQTLKEEKAVTFSLSKKVAESDEVEIPTLDAARIIERVNVMYPSPLVYGRVCEILGQDLTV